jgi:ABC-2 type transport system permease protein
VALFLLLAQLIYFQGVIGISESSAPSKKMTRDDVVSGTRSQSVLRSYFQKEVRLLFRSPTALMNCVLMVFIMPLMLLTSFGISFSQSGMDINSLIALDYNNSQTVAYLFVGASAMGILIGCMNLVTTTCISREGPNYIFMKYIPVSYRTQLNAKAASGLLVSFMGLAVTLIGLEIIFKAPPLVFLGVLVLIIPGTVLINYVGLLIDLIKPKLNWDNEQRAVKQNMNVMLMMLGGMALTAAIGIFGAIFFKTAVTAFITLLAVMSVLAIGAMQVVLTIGEEKMEKLTD